MTIKGAQVTPIWETLSVKYGAVGLGLLAGILAKYGLTLSKGRLITWRMMLADALLMGVVALASVAAVDKLGLTGANASLLSALLAMTSDRVIRVMRERFLQRVEAQIYRDVAADVIDSRGEVRQAAQMRMSADRVLKGEGDE